MSGKKYKVDPNSEVNQELRDLESSLVDIDYKKSFDVPKGYWEEQESVLLKHVVGDEDKMSSGSNIRKFIPWIIGIAASVAITFFVIVNGSGGAMIDEDGFLENIELSELEEYILDEADLLYDTGELDEAYLVIE